MWTADWLAFVYFAYLAVTAWLVPRVRPRRRVAVSAIALVIVALIRGATAWLAYVTVDADVVLMTGTPHQWSVAPGNAAPGLMVPGLVGLAHAALELVWLLLGYWLPAALWRGPMPRVEAWLRASDRWLEGRTAHGPANRAHLPSVAADPCRARWWLSVLEAAYLLVHLVVPAAWLMLMTLTHGRPPELSDRFWTCILLAGYACYGTLPWIQTRPPRALSGRAEAHATRNVLIKRAADAPPPPASAGGLRRLNLRILDSLSVRVNTFPSGHTAVAITAALCVSSTDPFAGAIFLILAALIAIATVVLRYHYTADTVLGLAVGLTVWLLVW